jgi:hypothetical protein
MSGMISGSLLVDQATDKECSWASVPGLADGLGLPMRGIRVLSASLSVTLALGTGVLSCPPGAVGQPIVDAGAAASTSTLIPGGSLHSVTPRRIVDTRIGLGAVAGPSTLLTVGVGGQGGVPSSGVSAVAVHITVTGPAASGYLTVARAGAARPRTSDVLFSKGQTITGVVLAAVDTAGRFVIYSSQRTQLIVDVEAYFTDVAHAAGGGLFVPTIGTRLLDTRTTGRPLMARTGRSVRVTGVAGVLGSGVRAVVVNITVVGPPVAGYLAAYPAGSALPRVTTLTFGRGQTIAARAIVAVGSGGAINLYANAGPSTVLVDITGYFTTGTAGSYYVPVDPQRAVDGRDGGGWLTASEMPMTGMGTIPHYNAIVRPTATVASITAVKAGGAGYIATQPSLIPVHPVTSDVSYNRAGVTNLAIEAVGRTGRTGIVARGALATFIVDEYGYFALPLQLPPPGAWAWGDNGAAGYLVGDDGTNQLVTTPVSGPPGSVVWATSAYGQGFDLLADGRLQTWNSADTPNTRNTKTAITPTTVLSGVRSVAASNEIALAVKDDGTVWEQISERQWVPRPAVVSAIAIATENSGYGNHVGYALLADHSVVALDESCGGGMGCTATSLSKPRAITGLNDVAEISGGYKASYARRADGTVWAWGDNSRHQLGDGLTTRASTPQPVPGLTGVVQLAAGGFNDTYALKADGTVWRWGLDAPTPEQFTVPNDVVAIAPDQEGGDVVAHRADGTVWARQRDRDAFGPVPYLQSTVGASCGQYLCFAWS